jgi:pimeloyl-ACP methyl ester carboxylesterase
MAILLKTSTIQTSHATISVTHSGQSPNSSPTLPTILFIHGNSFSSKIFHPLLKSSLSTKYHLLAIDLPGHGSSSDALNPEESYTQLAYAEAALEVLEHLSIKEVIVFGWSLGGHVGIEMLAVAPEVVRGIFIVGTPPVNRDEVTKGFTFRGNTPPLAARDDLNDEEIEAFAHGCADPPYESWMSEVVRRTDQKARSVMFGHFKGGKCSDQRGVVEGSERLVAIVNGVGDPFIDLKFVRSVKSKALWKGECVELDELLHAPFWADNEQFVSLIGEFMEDVMGNT